MIRKFEKVSGRNIEPVAGCRQLAFSLSDTVDFFDMQKMITHMNYQGNIIGFHSFSNGEVYFPFEKKVNVIYGKPLFHDGFCWFLQGDFNLGKITLFRYFPGNNPEAIVCFQREEMDMYNLMLMGDGIHVVSMNDDFRCYYPEQFSFTLDPNETACVIHEGKVYTEVWIEEGWDEENECAGENYTFYDKVRERDETGEILSEETGTLCQDLEGNWWIG